MLHLDREGLDVMLGPADLSRSLEDRSTDLRPSSGSLELMRLNMNHCANLKARHSRFSRPSCCVANPPCCDKPGSGESRFKESPSFHEKETCLVDTCKEECTVSQQVLPRVMRLPHAGAQPWSMQRQPTELFR